MPHQPDSRQEGESAPVNAQRPPVSRSIRAGSTPVTVSDVVGLALGGGVAVALGVGVCVVPVS